MKFSTFVEVFVAALYNETRLSSGTEFAVGDILDRYHLPFEANWRDNFFKDYTVERLVNARRHLGPLRQQRVSLSSEGLRWVEDEIGENLSAFLEQHGAIYSDADFDLDRAIKSADWTGVAARLDATTRATIKGQAEALLKTVEQSDLDERTRKNVEKHITAALTLMGAPDPPWREIVSLLNHPALTAFLTALNVFQLIFGAAN